MNSTTNRAQQSGFDIDRRTMKGLPTWAKTLIIIVAIGAILGTIAFFRIATNGSLFGAGNDGKLTYEKVAPHVKEYLARNNIVGTDGTINVPNASGEVETIKVEEAIEKLITDGKFDYLKGSDGQNGRNGTNGKDGVNGKDGQDGLDGSAVDKGDKGDKGDTGATGAQGPAGATGAQGPKGDKGDTGATGATGAQGPKGDTGDKGDKGDTGATGSAGVLNVGSGLNLSGGTLTLKSCSVDQVLSYDGTTWDCATVTVSSVDTNTTNTSATLTLAGTQLTVAITDSDGHTISTNNLDLGTTFATDAEVAALIADMATKTWVQSQGFATTTALNALGTTVSGIDSRVTALENAGYITNSALSGYLQTTNLSSEMASRLAAGTGISITNTGGVLTINSTAQTQIFQVINDHTTLVSPDSNKIYIDIAANPAEQWIYENSSWQMIGQVNFDANDYYTKTQTDTKISDAINVNNAYYTTTADLNALLSGKQNALTAGTNITISGNIISATLPNNLVTTTDLTTALGNYYDKTEVDALFAGIPATDLSNYYTKSQTDALVQTAIDGKQDKINCATNQFVAGGATAGATSCVNQANYVTTSGLATALGSYYNKTEVDDLIAAIPPTDLSGYYNRTETDSAISTATNGMATQSWVTSQGYTTSSTVQSLITSALTNYIQDPTGTTKKVEVVTTLPANAASNIDTIYFVTGP